MPQSTGSRCAPAIFSAQSRCTIYVFPTVRFRVSAEWKKAPAELEAAQKPEKTIGKPTPTSHLRPHDI